MGTTSKRLSIVCGAVALGCWGGLAEASPWSGPSGPAAALAGDIESGLETPGIDIRDVVRPEAVEQRTGRAVPRGRGRPPAHRPPSRGRRGHGSVGYYPYPYYPFYPYGYGAYGFWDPFYWGHPPGYGGQGSYTGAVRLKIKPREAEVFVDGYYVGVVDEFDGAFQRLRLEPGPKRIDIRAPGFETLTFEVRITPGRTITYEAGLEAGSPGPRPGPAEPPMAATPPPGSAPARPPSEPIPAPPPAGAPGEPPDVGYGAPAVLYGGIRLKVEPRDAQVFVDGYYVGKVDDFDSGRGLPLESGPQEIEMRMDGYEPLLIEVRILPDETITYEGALAPIADPRR